MVKKTVFKSNLGLLNLLDSLSKTLKKPHSNLQDHRLPSASVNDGELAGMIRTQSARMAEISLASKTQEELRCFKRTLCIVGATMNNARETSESRYNKAWFAQTTAFRCYQCFSLRLMLFLASRVKWLPEKRRKYSALLLTAFSCGKQ